MYHQIEKTYNRNSESVIKVIEAKKDDNHNGYIRRDKKALLIILQRKKIYRLMQIIVVSFPYHIRLKKAIAQVVLKIKSADYTNL